MEHWPETGGSTRYFVAKCDSLDALRRCVISGKWACRERANLSQPHEILATAFEQGRVVLIFSVNNCHGWHGHCCMATPPDAPGAGGNDHVILKAGTNLSASDCEDGVRRSTANSRSNMKTALMETRTETDKRQHDEVSMDHSSPDASHSQPPDVWHHFQVEWQTHFITEFGETCLSSSQTQSLLLPDGSLLNKARNWQEVSVDVGHQVCELLDELHISLVARRKEQEEERLAALPLPFLHTEVDVCATESPEQYWRYTVQKVERELGCVHLACPYGSQRYNLQQPNSDIDAFIVYQAHTRDILGFDPPKLTLKNSEHEALDYTVLEVQRYCELLLAGDPRCIETLFLDDTTIVQVSDEWRKLQGLQQLFLTRKCLDKYLGDALGSSGVKRFQRWCREKCGVNGELPPPNRQSKLVYIIVRLLQNALDIVKGRPLCVFRPDGSPNHQLLQRLKKAEVSRNDIEILIQRLHDEIDREKDGVPSDSTEVKEKLENWLLSLRFRDFMTHPPQPAAIVVDS